MIISWLWTSGSSHCFLFSSGASIPISISDAFPEFSILGMLTLSIPISWVRSSSFFTSSWSTSKSPPRNSLISSSSFISLSSLSSFVSSRGFGLASCFNFSLSDKSSLSDSRIVRLIAVSGGDLSPSSGFVPMQWHNPHQTTCHRIYLVSAFYFPRASWYSMMCSSSHSLFVPLICSIVACC